jgi:site-specific DNA-methyltransferase (adenine-specific)
LNGKQSIAYRIGDCVEVLKEFPDGHFDACVTDPPYGLEFMGKAWDKLQKDGTWQVQAHRDDPHHRSGPRLAWNDGRAIQGWHEAWASEVLRVLKPGAHLLAFGGTRTHHRLMCALEDAGFEIRDCLMWLYGSGFPKSLDVSKAIDKAAGVERTEVIQHRTDGPSSWLITQKMKSREEGGTGIGYADGSGKEYDVKAPATPEAAKWSGWGTALKPAWEPIILARKPLSGTVAENVLQHGTGGLNVDGGRIGTIAEKPWGGVHPNRGKHPGWPVDDNLIPAPEPHPQGRWPANVLLDEEAARLLDEQSGERSAGARPKTTNATPGALYDGGWKPQQREERVDLDSGGASRFFYTAKASREEREAGLHGLPLGDGPGSGRVTPAEGRKSALGKPRQNHHPTIKPLDLMRYLVRLVTPPGGLVLDPFLGSGTTLLACRLEGFSGFGIEKGAEYESIIKGRLGAIPPPIEGFLEAYAPD